MNIRQETASAEAPALATSFPPELRKLAEQEERISSIAVEMADLQKELTRLRAESEAVERAFDARQAELGEKEVLLTRLADKCARAEQGEAAAQASRAEAEKLLDGSRGRVVALERELELLKSRITELTIHTFSPAS